MIVRGLLVFWVIFDLSVRSIYGFVNFNETTRDGNKRPHCHIVIHDSVKGFFNWHQEFFVKVAKAMNIQIDEIGRGGNLQNADVLIFHAPSHKSNIEKASLKKKYKKAVFVMTSMEQPFYYPILQQLGYLNQNFDMMVTYSLRSIYPGTTLPNLPITYFPSHIVPVESVLSPGKSFSEKTGYGTGVSVVLFTSNCKAAGATQRYKYIEELMKHIEVHSYGTCLKNRDEPSMPNDPTWPPIAQRRARKIKVLSNYKFYLAFENAPIDDYVSEKVFEGLLAGTISVYRGAKQIGQFMPSNSSFINANALTAPELASLLKKIGSDEKLYNSYFQWKQEPLSEQFRSIGEMSYVHPNVVKRICDSALQHRKGKV